MFDTFGDRMKRFEQQETDRRIMHGIPIIARMDGRGFSSVTENFDRPYDKEMSDIMMEVTQYLVRELGAVFGYTQSDEITLVWKEPDRNTQVMFDGKVSKLVSTFAAMTTAAFGALYRVGIDETKRKPGLLPTFDARVFGVPSREVAADQIWWRELDATRNSIQMAARAYFSHKQCMNQNCSNLHEMLHVAGINWNDYPAFFKRGTCIQRRQVTRVFTSEELDMLPQKHHARQNPTLVVTRQVVGPVDMPPFTQVLNKEAVIFDGADPLEAAHEPTTPRQIAV